MSPSPPLPPGQYGSVDFPRFGLTPFADRFPKDPNRAVLKIGGAVEDAIVVEDELAELPRTEQVSDFHCVTTWSCRALAWSGHRFRDFYSRIVEPRARPDERATLVGLWGQDTYRTTLPLQDLLAGDVLLADTLNGAPLNVEHGAPLRLVAPAHYGYKNVKHLCRVEFHLDESTHKPAGFRFMDHPRARVASEERGRGAPGWLYRILYRPLVRSTARRFGRAMSEHYEPGLEAVTPRQSR